MRLISSAIISRKMKGICIALAGICLFGSSCEKKSARMTVEETRGQTAKDRKPKLFATSDERFRNAKPSPVRGDAPENWLELPSAQFRELNYRFGESGFGEVYVSLSGGTVSENVNRWVSQFGNEPLSSADLSAMEKTSIAGTVGVMVEAAGNYAAGMGQEPKPGYALAGVIAEVGDKILTLKMIGPEAEVEKEKALLKGFAASLNLVDN